MLFKGDQNSHHLLMVLWSWSKRYQLRVNLKAIQLYITKHIYLQNCAKFDSKNLSEIDIHS